MLNEYKAISVAFFAGCTLDMFASSLIMDT